MEPSMSQANDSSLVTQRLLPADPCHVFAAFEQPDLLAQWWGPNGFTSTFETFHFTPGGRWLFVMHGPNGANYPNECIFRTIEPHSRIIIEHIPNPWFLLTITLAPQSSQTHLTWAQQFENPQIAAKMQALAGTANEQVLDRLEALLKQSIQSRI